MLVRMDSVAATATIDSQNQTVAVYQALIARRAMSQQRLEGQQALQLTEAAAAQMQAQTQRALPPGATYSIRV
jgi:multidrug efflux pump subunit AcrA (membrane-fusion protein)